MTRTNALLVSILFAACSSDLGASGFSGSSAPSDPDDDGDRHYQPQASPEQCNHYDDDLDGLVDDGCPCQEGQTQWCWASTPGQEEAGTCAPGVQACDTSQVEFPEWGPCEGAILPARDVCDDGEDQDCDGEDLSCRAPDGQDVDDPAPPDEPADDPQAPDEPADDPAQDPQQNQDQNDCVPAAEVCGNGLDEDCDGADAECEVVEVDLFIIGDCVTATCPPEAPYPVGCNVIFTPGDDRGCVASQTDDSTVYFQAGDECDQGLVMGTLLCSPIEGEPLDDENCPINKPVPIYAADRNGCPDTH